MQMLIATVTVTIHIFIISMVTTTTVCSLQIRHNYNKNKYMYQPPRQQLLPISLANDNDRFIISSKQICLQSYRIETINDEGHLEDGIEPLPRDSTFLTYTDWSRRSLLTTTAASLSIGSQPCYSYTDNGSPPITSKDDFAVLKCLQDLPQYNRNTTVRLFLCRHGETDFNRNNIIQGARIDPPINNMGVEQAKLLGLTLAHCTDSVQSSTIILHSPLQRAKQTAQIVAQQIYSYNKIYDDAKVRQSQQQQTNHLRQLDSLAEVDFGPIAEGAPIMQYRNELISLYTSWMLKGDYNARMSNAGGENGFEILHRIGNALQTMIHIAAYETESKSLIAITHSSYLRLLLSSVQQDFTYITATLPLSNCGINVVDFPYSIPMTRTATNLNIYGKDTDIKIPNGNIIRINERRFLNLISSDRTSTFNIGQY